MAMTDEEKQAIERTKSLLKFNLANPFLEHESDDISTILNLIEKQQEEISNLKWENEIYVKSIKSHDTYENELNDEIIVKNNKIFDLETELEKKNKIIDEMAEILSGFDFDIMCEECPCGVGNGCYADEDIDAHMDCIKEHFKKKVEDQQNEQ